MRLTVNQVEHILERWLRLRRGNQVHFGSSDPTRLTIEARREAQQYVAANSTAGTGITPRNILERIGDFKIPDPAIDYAEQRRAGQFLDPPYIPSINPVRSIQQQLVKQHKILFTYWDQKEVIMLQLWQWEE